VLIFPARLLVLSNTRNVNVMIDSGKDYACGGNPLQCESW